MYSRARLYPVLRVVFDESHRQRACHARFVTLLASTVCLCLVGAATSQEPVRSDSSLAGRKTKEQGSRRKDGESAADDRVQHLETSDQSASQQGDGHRETADKRPLRPKRPLARVSEWSRMSEAEKEELEAFVKKEFPEVWAELEADKAKKPRVYNKQMERLAPELVPLMDQRDANPERAGLSIRERQLQFSIQRRVSDYLSEEDEAKQAALEQEIAALVKERFEVRQNRRWLDIRGLEERVARLKQLHVEKNENRDRIIGRELNDLLNPAGVVDDSKDHAEAKDDDDASQGAGAPD